MPVRRLAKNGFEAWAEVISHDFEGLVAKEEASLYEAGPTRRWLKVKQQGWALAEDRWQRRISADAKPASGVFPPVAVPRGPDVGLTSIAQREWQYLLAQRSRHGVTRASPVFRCPRNPRQLLVRQLAAFLA